MISLLLALAAPPEPITLRLSPTDDVWVYPFAGSPVGDPFLRVWGSGGLAVAPSAAELDDFSYSYLRWSVDEVPRDAELVEAKLILVHVPNPGFTPADAQKAPIEVRGVGAGFEEKTWAHGQAETLPPRKETFGAGAPGAGRRDEDIRFEIDLLAGPGSFREHLEWSGTHIALALTSKLDPAQVGRTGIYRLHSRHADNPEHRPVLMLVFRRS
jgi:hypothetical protein